MNQQKIGRFLRELRCEKEWTQEQLAERLGISNRSVSRWENGNTMPDFDLLLQLARLYDVDVEEILDGERSPEPEQRHNEETLLKIAAYQNQDREFFPRRIRWIFLVGLLSLSVNIGIDFAGLAQTSPWDFISGFALGICAGGMLVGVFYSSRRATALRALKLRLFRLLTGKKE